MERHQNRGPRRRSRSRDRDFPSRNRDRDYRGGGNRDRRSPPRNNHQNNRDKLPVRDNRDYRDRQDNRYHDHKKEFIPRHRKPLPGEKDPLFTASGKKKGSKYIGDGHVDDELPEKHDDPREGEIIYRNKGGRNTESFDPASTFVRPGMRIICGPNNVKHYPKPCKHDDVIVVPGFGCEEDDLTLYYKLVEEMRSL